MSEWFVISLLSNRSVTVMDGFFFKKGDHYIFEQGNSVLTVSHPSLLLGVFEVLADGLNFDSIFQKDVLR